MSSQEAALSIGPTVVEAGGEVCKDGHFGFCGLTFTVRRAGHLGSPTLRLGSPLLHRGSPNFHLSSTQEAEEALCSGGSNHACTCKLPSVSGSAPSLPRARSRVSSLSTQMDTLKCRWMSALPTSHSRPWCPAAASPALCAWPLMHGTTKKATHRNMDTGTCISVTLEAVTPFSFPVYHPKTHLGKGKLTQAGCATHSLHDRCQLSTRQAAWALTGEQVGTATHLPPPLQPWLQL